MFSRVLLKAPFLGLTATTTAKNLFFGFKPCHRSKLCLDELVNEVSKCFVRSGSIITYCTTTKDSVQEKQREAIMESLRAVEKYCFLPSSGEQRDNDCSNHDSSVSDKRERDVSKESFLLLNCIKSCGGRRGLTIPINILQGSRLKQITENNFDKLPVHGLGKYYTPAWWKALGGLLIYHGYLREVVVDNFRRVSVSVLGLQYLQSVNFSDQPPLILELTSNMIDEEYHRVQQSNIDNNKGLIEANESLSEVEKKLYNILLHLRTELAKDYGAPPFIICGDQALSKIAKIRPSTTARLANIEGVNQHFISLYGDKFLQAVSNTSQEFDLSLDGEKKTVTTMRKAYGRSMNNQFPAKFEAWNVWQLGKKSLKEVGALGRSFPIKEQTVISYILDAARTGCEVDWDRFCTEIGLTHEIFLQIRSTISRMGSIDRLKPIKDELPENVSYDHIKTFLTMDSLNISADEIFDRNSSLLPSNSTETECESFVSGRAEQVSDHSAAMNGITQNGCGSQAHESSAEKLHTKFTDTERAKTGFDDSMIDLVIKDRDGGV